MDYAALIVDDEKEIKRFSRAGFVVVSRLECQTDIAVKGERIHYQGRIVAFDRRRGNEGFSLRKFGMVLFNGIGPFVLAQSRVCGSPSRMFDR